MEHEPHDSEPEPSVAEPIPERREAEPAFPDLAVVSTTFYPGLNTKMEAVRQELAEKFFSTSRDEQIKSVVVDGGSNDRFLEFLHKLPNVDVVVDRSLGMGASRRAGIARAIERYNTPYYLWSEPEKVDLLRPDTLHNMLTPLREGKTDLVVPIREDTETMDRFQAWIEHRANRRASRIDADTPTPEELDLWFGPKMFDRDAAQFFLDYQGSQGSDDRWESIIAPVILARRAGERVQSVPVRFSYSEAERELEKELPELKKKRLDQYQSVLREIGDPHWGKR